MHNGGWLGAQGGIARCTKKIATWYSTWGVIHGIMHDKIYGIMHDKIHDTWYSTSGKTPICISMYMFGLR